MHNVASEYEPNIWIDIIQADKKIFSVFIVYSVSISLKTAFFGNWFENDGVRETFPFLSG